MGNQKTTRIRRRLYAEDPYCHYCRVKLVNSADPRFKDRQGVGQNRSAKVYNGWRGLYWTATTDHIHPYSEGGRLLYNDERNAVLSCMWCNSRKGSMSYEEWMSSEPLQWRKLFLINLDARLAQRGWRQYDVTIEHLLEDLAAQKARYRPKVPKRQYPDWWFEE